MGVLEFTTEIRELVDEHGVRGLKYASENFTRGFLVRLGMTQRAFTDFRTLLDEEWDLLLILDACRYDAMKEVEEEYDFLTVEPHVSYASSSQDWLQKTFFQPDVSVLDRLRTTGTLWVEPYQNDVIAETFEMRDVSDVSYITANPQSTMLDGSEFAYFEEVWRMDWDHDIGQLPPAVVTDRTIDVMRERSVDRTIVHYMQPHGPFRMAEDPGHMPWVELQTGAKSASRLWEEYVDNLRWVLDSVELLLANTDAETVVITADHGEQFGDWGVYGHRPYLTFEEMRRVPWVETTATDEGTYEPKEIDRSGETDVNRLLEYLGYR